MKHTIALIIICFCATAHAQNEKKTVKEHIKEVTVFLSQAQINSTASTSIEQGITEVVLEGLPVVMDKQSVQVSGKGDFIIMAVKPYIDYLKHQESSHEVAALEDSVDHYKLKQEEVTNHKDVLNKEEQMILANQKIGGNDNGLKPIDLEEMADIFRERMLDIRNGLLKDEHSLKKINQKLSGFQNQLNQLNAKRNQPTAKIAVTVSSKMTQSVTFNYSYLVSNAGWTPIYDLRAKNVKSPVQLAYKAQVHQSTGMEWDKVKLTLSTSNPSQGGTKPELNTWNLSFYNPVVYKKNKAHYAVERSMSMGAGAPAAAPKAEEMDKEMELKNNETVANYTQMSETAIAAEFAIAVPYTIPSDGVGQLVDIQNFELPAFYKYFSVPKMDKDAFLVANITQWEGLNLLSGNVNVYFEGTYVAQSYLDMENTKDTLEFSLGRDKKVVIERKRVKDFTKKSFLGTNKKEDYGFEINIRNTKKDSIDITLEDQVPVTTDNQIEVTLEDGGGAEYNKETGKLTWKLKISPADTKTLRFKFTVKYPKNKTINGLY